jgi:3'-phosphoadenosine 5'-phosphosulfate sulfotransferase (PAPS reductase)/FAD synthetase
LQALTREKFIRRLRIPYCPLYDLGYTSLGGTTDTHRNPALRRESVSNEGAAQVEFRPAYELVEDREERLGRDREWKPTTGSGLMHRVAGSVEDCAIADDDSDGRD